MILAVTDQNDRCSGWCWHVCADCMYGNEEIERGGGMRTADAAKEAAKAWARDYCERTLNGIYTGCPNNYGAGASKSLDIYRPADESKPSLKTETEK